MEIEQSIYIVLTDTESEVGEKVAVVTKETIDKLRALVLESEKLGRNGDKLRGKTEQVKRRARKLLDRIVASHGVKLKDHTEAVGISKTTDELYVGEKERIIADPELPPTKEDKVVGKVTKQERRKYNELLERYNYLANKIDEHNHLVKGNEDSLIAFEKSTLAGKEYDKEKQYLSVSLTGKVHLVTKE